MKTEVYSWRVSAEKKLELEAEARREGKSVAQLLDEISSSWLKQRHSTRRDDDAEQQQLRRRLLATAGTVRGGDPTRSGRSRELAREAIWKRNQKERNASERID
jgi:hypothetical protein